MQKISEDMEIVLLVQDWLLQCFLMAFTILDTDKQSLQTWQSPWVCTDLYQLKICLPVLLSLYLKNADKNHFLLCLFVLSLPTMGLEDKDPHFCSGSSVVSVALTSGWLFQAPQLKL